MEKFGETYDVMTRNYNQMEELLGSLYEEEDKEKFLKLSVIAKEYLHDLAFIVENNCPADMKDTCLDSIQRKEATLSDAIENASGMAL